MPNGSNNTQLTELNRDALSQHAEHANTPPPSAPTLKPTPTAHFLAGALSGLTTSVLLQPADLLKTRIQQSGSHHASLSQTLRSIFSSSSSSSNNKSKTHPLKTLYRGTLPSVLRTTLGSALYFTTLSTFRNHPLPLLTGKGTGASTNPSPTATQNLLAGSLSRTLATLLLMPITVLKVRYESSLYAYPSLLSATQSILRTEGLRGFFSGSGATAVRDAPYAGLYVVFYEGTKRRLQDTGLFPPPSPPPSSNNSNSNNHSNSTTPPPAPSIPLTFTSGLLAASLATLLTNPFDAIKTRVQLLPTTYRNTFVAAALMLRREGWRCLMDGLGLRMARKALSSALAWSVYEGVVGRRRAG